MARGLTNPQIGEELGISRGTAKVHVQNIIAKLGVSDRTQAAVRAVELGLFGRGD
jgi:DNA-binding NarL/FixJ family response regulator